MQKMAFPDGWTDDMNATAREDRTILEFTKLGMERI